MGGLVSELSHEGMLRHLRLDAGPGNVLDRDLLGALEGALSEAAEDTRLRAVVLGHTGKHFSYGASVPEHLPGEVETMIPAFGRVCRRLVDLPVALLAAVGGRCLGGGLELVLPATRIFAAPNAVLGQPEVQLAVFAPVASLLLPARVGQAGAEDLLLVDEVTEGPEDAAVAYAEAHLLSKSAFALRLALEAARTGYRARFAEALPKVERLYLDTLMSGQDPVEGLNAFIGKRQPTWSDR
jgi:cyclohexa-1,5-dienecarbonyl-CoA hydratase